MNEVKQIRVATQRLAKKAGLVDSLRDYAKTPGGRMSDFGKAVLAAGKHAGVKQSHIADILGISRGAVSQHYNK